MQDQPQPIASARRVTIFAIVGSLAILFFMLTTRASDWFTPTYRLHAYMPDAEGIIRGAPVRLNGLEIGRVESVGVNPDRQDRTNNIHVVLLIESKYQAEIRSDSHLTFETRSLLGEVGAALNRGFEGPPLLDNSRIQFVASPRVSFGGMVEKMADCVKTFSNAANEKPGENNSKKKDPNP